MVSRQSVKQSEDEGPAVEAFAKRKAISMDDSRLEGNVEVQSWPAPTSAV
jgi:hypothetical protein